MASLIESFRYHNGEKTFRKYLTYAIFKRRDVNGKFMEMINANRDKPWDWQAISLNPNITMEIINANPDEDWNWKWITNNKFEKDNKLFYRKNKIIYDI